MHSLRVLPSLVAAGIGALLLLAPVELAGQAEVVIRDHPACPCGLEVELALTIEDESGAAGLSRPFAMTRMPDGHFLVVPTTTQSRIVDFDPTGAFEGVVARQGQGPEEIGMARAFLPGPADTVVVLDMLNGRLAFLAPEPHPTRVARTLRLDRQGGWAGLLPDGGVAVLGGITGGGDRLHVLGADGTHVRSFMPSPPRGPDTDIHTLRRRIITGANGTIIVAHAAEYRIEFWTPEGTLTRTLVRDTSTERFDSPADGWFDLVALRLDDEGRLWTLTWVRDPDAAAPPSVPPPGPLPPPEPDFNEQFDSIVEVLDPDTGELLGSVRLDEAVLHPLPGGMGASYRENEIGLPYIDVWELSLEGS